VSQITPEMILEALGDGTRRKMISDLSQGPMSVSLLSQNLGVSLTAIGQHLHVLEACGLVSTHKIGRVRSCQLNDAGFVILENWASAMKSPWRKRLEWISDVLDSEK
jgi:DNA-binding transcriptional ArsR family regulator